MQIEITEVMREFPSLRLMGTAKDWRGTKRKRGTLRGLSDRVGEVVLVATDGLAAFVLQADGQLFHCHLANFEEDKVSGAAGSQGRDRHPRKVSVSLQHLMNLAAED